MGTSPRTATGGYTIDTIRLNRLDCVRFRLRRRATAARIALRGAIQGLDGNPAAHDLAETSLAGIDAEWEVCFGGTLADH